MQPVILALPAEWDIAQEQEVGTRFRKSKSKVDTQRETGSIQESQCVWCPHWNAFPVILSL